MRSRVFAIFFSITVTVLTILFFQNCSQFQADQFQVGSLDSSLRLSFSPFLFATPGIVAVDGAENVQKGVCQGGVLGFAEGNSVNIDCEHFQFIENILGDKLIATYAFFTDRSISLNTEGKIVSLALVSLPASARLVGRMPDSVENFVFARNTLNADINMSTGASLKILDLSANSLRDLGRLDLRFSAALEKVILNNNMFFDESDLRGLVGVSNKVEVQLRDNFISKSASLNILNSNPLDLTGNPICSSGSLPVNVNCSVVNKVRPSSFVSPQGLSLEFLGSCYNRMLNESNSRLDCPYTLRTENSFNNVLIEENGRRVECVSRLSGVYSGYIPKGGFDINSRIRILRMSNSSCTGNPSSVLFDREVELPVSEGGIREVNILANSAGGGVRFSIRGIYAEDLVLIKDLKVNVLCNGSLLKSVLIPASKEFSIEDSAGSCSASILRFEFASLTLNGDRIRPIVKTAVLEGNVQARIPATGTAQLIPSGMINCLVGPGESSCLSNIVVDLQDTRKAINIRLNQDPGSCFHPATSASQNVNVRAFLGTPMQVRLEESVNGSCLSADRLPVNTPNNTLVITALCRDGRAPVQLAGDVLRCPTVTPAVPPAVQLSGLRLVFLGLNRCEVFGQLSVSNLVTGEVELVQVDNQGRTVKQRYTQNGTFDLDFQSTSGRRALINFTGAAKIVVSYLGNTLAESQEFTCGQTTTTMSPPSTTLPPPTTTVRTTTTTLPAAVNPCPSVVPNGRCQVNCIAVQQRPPPLPAVCVSYDTPVFTCNAGYRLQGQSCVLIPATTLPPPPTTTVPSAACNSNAVVTFNNATTCSVQNGRARCSNPVLVSGTVSNLSANDAVMIKVGNNSYACVGNGGFSAATDNGDGMSWVGLNGVSFTARVRCGGCSSERESAVKASTSVQGICQAGSLPTGGICRANNAGGVMQ